MCWFMGQGLAKLPLVNRNLRCHQSLCLNADAQCVNAIQSAAEKFLPDSKRQFLRLSEPYHHLYASVHCSVRWGIFEG